MTYSVINVVLSSRSDEQSDKEDGGNNNDQWDGKTSWDHLPKVKVRAEQLGMIGSKLHDYIQKELDLYFPFPSDQQLVAMVYGLVMLMLALPWLCAIGYDIDNSKELFKSALVDEATHLLRPPKLDTTPNTTRNNDDDNANVKVCDNDDVFGMVKVSLVD
jgi:hypothetical protein